MYTVSRRWVDSTNIDPNKVNAWDIAWALKQQNRYLGNTLIPWSVLDHLGLCCQLYVQDKKEAAKPEELLLLMLHDAPEAYLGDIIRPLKILPEFAGYLELEKKGMDVILRRFGLGGYDDQDWDMVRVYDDHALYVEYQGLGLRYEHNEHIPQPCLGAGVVPKLTAGNPKDFIPFLRDLCVQIGTQDIGALFEFPQMLEPYLDPKAFQPVAPTEVSDAEAMLERKL